MCVFVPEKFKEIWKNPTKNEEKKNKQEKKKQKKNYVCIPKSAITRIYRWSECVERFQIEKKTMLYAYIWFNGFF